MLFSSAYSISVTVFLITDGHLFYLYSNYHDTIIYIYIYIHTHTHTYIQSHPLIDSPPHKKLIFFKTKIPGFYYFQCNKQNRYYVLFITNLYSTEIIVCVYWAEFLL